MYKLKKDKYQHSRGGFSKLLLISCTNCTEFIMLYQKDGDGSLKRAYFDRILEPATLINTLDLLNKDSNYANLVCSKCKQVIGNPYIYKKENRPAFSLHRNSFSKKIYKAHRAKILNQQES